LKHPGRKALLCSTRESTGNLRLNKWKKSEDFSNAKTTEAHGLYGKAYHLSSSMGLVTLWSM
jgi:hypothetical protein